MVRYSADNNLLFTISCYDYQDHWHDHTNIGNVLLWLDFIRYGNQDVGWYMSTVAIRKKLARRGELLGALGLTARVLRHFHASVALQNGHNIVAMSKCLGHARVSVMSDIYAHVLPAWQRDVAEGLAAVMWE